MKEHNGMRPQDVVVLLKIAARPEDHWYLKDIANALNISASEVSESINRSKIAGLIDHSGKHLRRMALLDFLFHGLRYVFPQKPGAKTRGVPTSHSAPPLDKMIRSRETFVWPSPEGKALGFTITPLYKTVAQAAMRDPKFYEFMALVDALRVGKAREIELAKGILRKMVK